MHVYTQLSWSDGNMLPRPYLSAYSYLYKTYLSTFISFYHFYIYTCQRYICFYTISFLFDGLN